MTAAHALDGIRVVDFSTYLPGPYASLMLADFGADVIHVESPDGDPSRHLPDRVGSDSAIHHWLSRGTGSERLDLKSSSGAARARALITAADVVIEGFAPGSADQLGIGFAQARELRPDVVYCSISAEGYRGHFARFPGHDLDFAARSGVLDQARDAGGYVVPFGLPVADISAGIHAAFGILVALRHRDRTGEGQFLDVSLLAGALAMAAPQLVKSFAGSSPQPGVDLNLGGDPAYRAYRTRDGRQLVLAGVAPKYFQRICDAIGRPELANLRAIDAAAAHAELAGVFALKDLQEWDALLDPLAAGYAPVNRLEDVPTDAHVVASGLLLESSGGRRLSNPIRMGDRNQWIPTNVGSEKAEQ